MCCGWGFFLSHWLKSIGNENIKIYNFALGGATSDYMSAVLTDLFHKVFEPVLIDLNDAVSLTRNPSDIMNYQKSLELKVSFFVSTLSMNLVNMHLIW